MNIITAAAKLTKSHIKLVSTCSENYPTIETDVQSHIDFLPSTLKLFLEGILTSKNNAMKIASLGQAIVQFARPCGVLSLLQVGLAVQLHHSFASRSLPQQFLGAILGCDTTSRLTVLEKPRPLKNMVNLSSSRIKRRYSTSRDQLKPRLRQRERML